jgi:hypothetical protein
MTSVPFCRQFVARQINDPPLAAMLLGAAAIGYFASLLIHGRR